jgi:hypothetical protein
MSSKWLPTFERVNTTTLHDDNVFMPLQRKCYRIEWLGYKVEIYPPLEPTTKAVYDWGSRFFGSKK